MNYFLKYLNEYMIFLCLMMKHPLQKIKMIEANNGNHESLAYTLSSCVPSDKCLKIATGGYES